MTSDQETDLCEAAFVGMKNAYSKNKMAEDFRVGAAILTRKGNIYSSGSYFSLTHSLTLHAEQACLAHAAAHGEYDAIAIAIVSNDPDSRTINPCSMCKQLLWESQLRSGEEISILLIDNQARKVTEILALADINPHPWPEQI